MGWDGNWSETQWNAVTDDSLYVDGMIGFAGVCQQRWMVEGSGVASAIPKASTVGESGRAVTPRGFDSCLMF